MSEKERHVLLKNIPALTNMVRRVAIAAGEIILEYYEDMSGADIVQKEDGSPVSRADRDAEKYITAALLDILPDVPVVGEEAAELGQLPDFAEAEYFWLVDPLDGTKEFITGGNDFTVNIALIHNKVPVLGVVYAPVTGVLYAGCGTGTAVRWSEEAGKDKSIHVRRPPSQGLVVVGSRSYGDNQQMNDFLNRFKIQKVIKRGSSLKICSIAEGKADMYPRFGPTCEWDTAAGHAVLNAAGGYLVQADGSPLTYGAGREKILNPEFVASSFEWF